jgi:hypothetical protein
MNFWKRFLTAGLLGLSLSVSLPPPLALAQGPEPAAPAAEEENTQPDPIPGYLIATIFAGVTIFLVCRSARR